MLKSRAPRASPVLSRSGIAMWFSPQTEAKRTSELSVHLKRKSLKSKPNKHKGIEDQPVDNIPPKHTESLSFVPTTLQPTSSCCYFICLDHFISWFHRALPQLTHSSPLREAFPTRVIWSSSARVTLPHVILLYCLYWTHTYLKGIHFFVCLHVVQEVLEECLKEWCMLGSLEAAPETGKWFVKGMLSGETCEGLRKAGEGRGKSYKRMWFQVKSNLSLIPRGALGSKLSKSVPPGCKEEVFVSGWL